MKRIAILVCGLVLVVANTAEARRNRGSNYMTYTQPVAAAPTSSTAATSNAAATSHVAYKLPVTAAENAASAEVKAAAKVTTVSYSTATAQGVANLMARDNSVRHYGGNPGYEGCGCGATAQAAYNICCYGNSGMATVDVGYAQGRNGMWYCCRRYR